MKKQIYNCLLSLLLITSTLFFASGQDLNTHQKIDSWFHEQRFILADQNDDALLDKQELARFNKEFVYFISNRYFNLSDVNQDGYLSFGEMFGRRNSEYKYRYNIERNQLKRLIQQYPELPNASLTYLKNNPTLVSTLFGNLVWMYEQEELVHALLADPNWMQKNPQSLIALHRNLRWMAANPSRAKKLYQDRSFTQKLPEFVSWRADHKRFIRNNSLLDRFYEISFLPESIYLQR